MAPGVAEVVDPAGGFRDVLGYLGSGSDRVASCTHLPATGEAAGGVVACPSLFNEFLKNYRREVVLARELARRGMATVRLQYRGTANSDGDPTSTTFESMVADVALAAEHLATEVRGAPRAVLATRFGALPAAGWVAAHPGLPLVLVEPVTTAEAFFTEGFRNRLFTAGIRIKRSTDVAGPRSVQDLLAELETAGVVDLLGYSLGRELYRSTSQLALAEMLGGHGRPVLVVQLGADRPLRPELAQLAEALRAASCDVELVRLGDREQWWLPDEREEAPGAVESRPHGLTGADPLVAAVGDWLATHLDAARLGSS